MSSILQDFETSRSRSLRIYRWVTAWLVLGVVIALLLLANSIRDYRVVSRIIATDHVRNRMGRQAAILEQQMRRTGPGSSANLQSLMGDSDRTVWIELRRADGTVLERAGESGPPLFSRSEEHLHAFNRMPLYKVLERPGGEVVVEVFSLHVGPPISGPNSIGQPASPPASPSGPHNQLILEIATPLSNVEPSVFNPIRRNLVISCTAALSLLVTVGLAGLGFRSYDRGRRLEEQLGIARQVQSELLPSLTEAYAGAQLATEYTPAEEVGGDFYDIFPIPDDGLALVMGDVSGKGVPAALLMGVIHGAVRSSAWTESAARHQRESELLNRLLCERASRERYASMFWCYYDPAAGALRYVNAGHCPPLLARPDGVSRLDAGGPVLGILEAAEYQQAVQPVNSGDVLAMYSDGLVEATNTAGEEYGESRLRDLLPTVRESSPDEIRRAILASLEAFSGGSPFQDDLTLVVAKFGSLAGPTPR